MNEQRESVINALIQAIRNAAWEGDVVRVSTEAARIIVDALKGQDWISVKDRLPEGRGEIYAEGLEDSATVLVACTTPDGRREYGLATYIRDHELAGDDGWNGIIDEIEEIGPKTKVTHWMPLPEMPEEREAEDENGRT